MDLGYPVNYKWGRINGVGVEFTILNKWGRSRIYNSPINGVGVEFTIL